MRVGAGGAEQAGRARGRAARDASGGACGQKYFGGVRAYAGARGRAQGKYFLFFYSLLFKSFQSCVLADRGRRTDGGGRYFCSLDRRKSSSLASFS